MRKYLILLLFLLFSCEKDFIEDDLLQQVPREDMVFKADESSVHDGQTIFFEIDSEVEHTLVIFDTETKSVVAKQSFSPTIGINDFVLYTKALPKEKLQLQLLKLSEEIKSTFIVVN